MDDTVRAFDLAGRHGHHRRGDETFPEIFPRAAEISGRGQRADRGGLRGAEYRKGV